MRQILALIATLCFVASVAAAQTPSQSAASKGDLLSMDQKIKISKLITKQTEPLAIPLLIDCRRWHIAVGDSTSFSFLRC